MADWTQFDGTLDRPEAPFHGVLGSIGSTQFECASGNALVGYEHTEAVGASSSLPLLFNEFDTRLQVPAAGLLDNVHVQVEGFEQIFLAKLALDLGADGRFRHRAAGSS